MHKPEMWGYVQVRSGARGIMYGVVGEERWYGQVAWDEWGWGWGQA